MNNFKFIISGLSVLLSTMPAYCSDNPLPDQQLPTSQNIVVESPVLEVCAEQKTGLEAARARLEEKRAELAATAKRVAELKQKNSELVEKNHKKSVAIKWSGLMDVKVKPRVVKCVSEGKKIDPRDVAKILGPKTTDGSYEKMGNYLYQLIKEELANPEVKSNISQLLAGCDATLSAIFQLPEFNKILTEYTRRGTLPLLVRKIISQLDVNVQQQATDYIKGKLDGYIAERKNADKKPALTREQQVIIIKTKMIQTRTALVRKQLKQLAVINCDEITEQIEGISDIHGRAGLTEMLSAIQEKLAQVQATHEKMQRSLAKDDLDEKAREIEAIENELELTYDIITGSYQQLLMGLNKFKPKKTAVEFEANIPMTMQSTKRAKAPRIKHKRSESMETIPVKSDSSEEEAVEDEEPVALLFKPGNEAETIFAQAIDGNKAFELLKILQDSRGNLFKLVKNLSVYPGSDLHELAFDRKGQYSIKINRGDRICFAKGNGTFTQVEIVNYH